jgi:hypothetical protein
MGNESPRCFASTPDHAFGAYRNLAIAVWRRETTVEAIQQFRRHLSDSGLAARHDLLMLTLVEKAADRPSAAAREATAEQLRSSAGMICRAATVLEGEGFRAATVRSIAMGLNLLASQPFPYNVFASATSAAEWLASESTSQLTSIEIVDALERIRSWEPPR